MSNEERIAETVKALQADLSAYWGGTDSERKQTETKVAELRTTYGEATYQQALNIVNAGIRNQ